MNYYHCFNLTIQSELILNGLIEIGQTQNVDVSILHGKVNLNFPINPGHRLYLIDADNYYFVVEGIAYFQIISGNKIIIEKDEFSDIEEVNNYLLNHVFNLLINQRKDFFINGTSFKKNEKSYLVIGSLFAISLILPSLFNLGLEIISDRLNKIEIIDNKPFICKGFQINKTVFTESSEKLVEWPDFIVDEIIVLSTCEIKNFEIQRLNGVEKISRLSDSVSKNELTAKMGKMISEKIIIMAQKCNMTLIKMPQVNFSLEGLISNLLSV